MLSGIRVEGQRVHTGIWARLGSGLLVHRRARLALGRAVNDLLRGDTDDASCYESGCDRDGRPERNALALGCGDGAHGLVLRPAPELPATDTQAPAKNCYATSVVLLLSAYAPPRDRDSKNWSADAKATW